MDRALLQASAAANATKDTAVIAGVVDQLMHKSLAESFLLRGTIRAVRHHGEVRVHTTVPAAETAHFPAVVKVLHIVTLTGRTDKGTSAAAKATFRKFGPNIRIEVFQQLLTVKIGQIQIVQRKFFQNFTGLFLHRCNCSIIAVDQDGQSSGQFFTLLGVCPPVQGILIHPAGNITGRIGCVDAKSTTEAIYENFGSAVRIFKTKIPIAVKAAEVSSKGKSIYAYEANSKAALAYSAFTKEVLNDAKKKARLRTSEVR